MAKSSQTQTVEVSSKATGATKFVKVGASSGDSTTIFVRASKLTEPGVVAEGIFAGTLPNKFEEDKQDYKIEALEPDENGNKLTYIVNAAGNLAYRMKSINIGDLIQIQYNGKQKSEKGRSKGKEVHNFDVLRAE